ncbi:hypothetical protein AURDEDRAFT_174537 [Auricularia subglabra TFB-10046 SS5]|uniref:Uncharacterized protein n=1 Tax=Auricularia subglabra (strain TFB-10046 / SS5) TaxID=717982 RepID=J0WUG8_AURST|nr:hypothetical protein AURDEDRAFT_174537 [Auricularia subglabra TFB-10046 SS5]
MVKARERLPGRVPHDKQYDDRVDPTLVLSESSASQRLRRPEDLHARGLAFALAGLKRGNAFVVGPTTQPGPPALAPPCLALHRARNQLGPVAPDNADPSNTFFIAS